MAHVKDKKVTFLVSTIEQDAELNPIVVWAALPGAENIWAYYRQASGTEIFQAATINTKVEAVFEINWRNDINTSMQIQYQGQDYNITRIDDFEGYKEALKIYAYKI